MGRNPCPRLMIQVCMYVNYSIVNECRCVNYLLVNQLATYLLMKSNYLALADGPITLVGPNLVKELQVQLFLALCACVCVCARARASRRGWVNKSECAHKREIG